MPEKKDLEKISKMLEELGNKELEIGETKEGTPPGAAARIMPKEEVPVPEEPAEVEETGMIGEEVEEPLEDLGLQELLKDIEAGIREEVELEEIEEPPIPPVEAKEGEPKPPVQEEFLEEEAVPSPEVPEAEEEAALPPVVEEEAVPSLEEEIFDLPEDFVMEDLAVKEGPPSPLLAKEREERAVPEEEAVEVPEEAAEPEKGIPEIMEEEELSFELEELMKPVAEEEGEGIALEEVAAEEEIAPLEYPPEEVEIELSDEDILFIKNRLTRLTPTIASRIRNSIVRGELPEQEINHLLRLLLRDAPEEEIVNYIERVTGKRIVPARVIPEVITVERKPGVLGVIAETMGPVARVAGLFLLIVAILSVLYMVYLNRPLRANRYYKEGIVYLTGERYEKAEESFQKAAAIHQSVKQYDRYGWEYMLSGNYDEAEQKFTQGIELDRRVRNLLIRLHLARLYTVLEEYKKADDLYSQVLSKHPDEYEYIKLKGVNLIEWGKKRDPQRLDEAYELFNNAIQKKRKNSDPFFKMLDIEITRKNDEGVEYLYNYLSRSYPAAVDREVYTELAGYYLARERFGAIRDILLKVLKSYPGYPQAHYTFAEYYRVINNRRMQEDFLKATIRAENARELHYPWEKRDRVLLSNAYNDLGEIFYQRETAGMAAEAISYFKKAIEENRQNAKAYFNIAQAYFYRERNYPIARQYYEKAQSIGYKNNDLFYNLGLIHYYESSFSSALGYWSELSRIMPENPNLSNALGSAFLHLGKYNAALGEYLLLSEVYDRLIDSLGDIKPWNAYHRRIVLESAAVHNNLGVAYQKLYEATGNPEYQKNSLVSLYKAGELADVMGTERGKIQYNIQYIIHPGVVRGGMAISDELNDNYRFAVQ